MIEKEVEIDYIKERVDYFESVHKPEWPSWVGLHSDVSISNQYYHGKFTKEGYEYFIYDVTTKVIFLFGDTLEGLKEWEVKCKELSIKLYQD